MNRDKEYYLELERLLNESGPARAFTNEENI